MIDWRTAGELLGQAATDVLTDADEIPLQDRVLRLLKDRLNLQVASPEADLLETGLDSLKFVQRLFHIEQEFGVAVCPDDLGIEIWPPA